MPLCRQPLGAVKPLVSRWPQTGSLLVTMAARIRASLRPRTGLPRALHTLPHWPLPHTQCSLPLAPWAHKGLGQRAALCSGAAVHAVPLHSTGLLRIGTSRSHLGKDSPQQPRPARRPHRDAPPHASLRVICISSPGSSIHILETVSTRRSVTASRAIWSLTVHFHTPCCATL